MKRILAGLLSFLKPTKRKFTTALVLYIGLWAALPAPTRRMIDADLPALDTERDAVDISPKLPAIVQLFRKGQFYCTVFVIGNNYAVTASHCLVDEDYEKTVDELDIRLDNKSTGVKAKAVGVYFRRDLGLIKGDFSKFDMLEVENDGPGFTLNHNELYVTCGYPGGNKHLMCVQFIPEVNDNFFIRGIGFLQPGMSGGPVINMQTKKVIGINTHVYDSPGVGGGAGVASMCGFLGTFEIEP